MPETHRSGRYPAAADVNVVKPEQRVRFGLAQSHMAQPSSSAACQLGEKDVDVRVINTAEAAVL
jgi:hypothetical protein